MTQPEKYLSAPAGCITASQACAKYNVHPDRMKTWLRRGRIQSAGRLKGAARGGLVLIRESELKSLLASPPKNGRPKLKPPLTTDTTKE